MASSGMNVVKYVFGLFNFAFMCGSAVMIYYGVQVFIGEVHVESEIINRHAQAQTVACILISSGAFVFLISFLGCWGAFRENTCMLLTFGSVLGVIVATQLILCTLLFVFREKMEEKATHEYLPLLVREYNFTESNDRLTKVVDDMQSRFRCCGVNGSADWKQGIPFSCCTAYRPLPPAELGADNLPIPAPGVVRYCPNDSQQPAYKEGCLEKVTSAVYNRIWYLASTAISFALIQIMAVVLACCVAYSVKKHYQVI